MQHGINHSIMLYKLLRLYGAGAPNATELYKSCTAHQRRVCAAVAELTANDSCNTSYKLSRV